MEKHQRYVMFFLSESYIERDGGGVNDHPGMHHQIKKTMISNYHKHQNLTAPLKKYAQDQGVNQFLEWYVRLETEYAFVRVSANKQMKTCLSMKICDLRFYKDYFSSVHLK